MMVVFERLRARLASVVHRLDRDVRSEFLAYLEVCRADIRRRELREKMDNEILGLAATLADGPRSGSPERSSR